MKKPSFAFRVVVGLMTITLIAVGSYLFEARAKAQGSMTGQLIPVVQQDTIVAYVDSGAVGQLSEQEKEVKGELRQSVKIRPLHWILCLIRQVLLLTAGWRSVISPTMITV